MLGLSASYASNAGIAQLVEHHLAKVEVASSSLVSRSNFNILRDLITTLFSCSEHLLDMVQVLGSNPPGPTKSKNFGTSSPSSQEPLIPTSWFT